MVGLTASAEDALEGGENGAGNESRDERIENDEDRPLSSTSFDA
jgi:hypothetical protein